MCFLGCNLWEFSCQTERILETFTQRRVKRYIVGNFLPLRRIKSALEKKNKTTLPCNLHVRIKEEIQIHYFGKALCFSIPCWNFFWWCMFLLPEFSNGRYFKSGKNIFKLLIQFTTIFDRHKYLWCSADIRASTYSILTEDIQCKVTRVSVSRFSQSWTLFRKQDETVHPRYKSTCRWTWLVKSYVSARIWIGWSTINPWLYIIGQ